MGGGRAGVGVGRDRHLDPGVDESAPGKSGAVAAFCAPSYCDPERLTWLGAGVGMYQSDVTSVRVTWKGFIDAESAVVACVVEIVEKESGAAVGASEPIVCGDIATYEAVLDGLALSDAGVYIARVTAINGAGLNSTVACGETDGECDHGQCSASGDADATRAA